jgi:serine/threonine protein kinase/tetratricopeptide (TPR) repeat protein
VDGAPDFGRRFAPIRRLGSGGMGEVWLVEDREIDRCVVAKAAHPVSDADRVWLRREYDLGSRLNHRNIVRVLGYHDQSPAPFMTMEFLAGGDIGGLIGAPASSIIDVLSQVAKALGYAHDRGVVHRDLKPSNVLLDEDGVPHVADFGIADTPGVGDRAPLVGGGSRAFISPQQLDGLAATPSDDIYAFGAIAHFLLAGSYPLGPEPTDEAIRSSTPPRLPSGAGISDELCDAIHRMLAKDPSMRPATMEEVLQCLSPPAPTESDRTTPPSAGGDKVAVRLVPPPRTGEIRPIGHRPPSSSSGAEPKPSGRRIGSATVALFSVLGLLVLLVFLVLPGLVDDRREQSVSDVEEVQAGTAPLPTAPAPVPLEPSQAAAEAERAWLDRRDELEARGAGSWGGADYQRALGLAADGESAMVRGEYLQAVAAFQQADVQLQAVAAMMPKALADALAAGDRALAGGDAAAASTAYTLAARMEPDNERARLGLSRARVLPEVLDLMDRGRAAERSGNLSAAAAAYRRAAELAPRFSEARMAASRVAVTAEDQAFMAAMSSALLALDRADLGGAREALETARSLRPSSSEVIEAQRRIDAEERRLTLESLRAAAEAAEQREDWAEAVSLYERVLVMDENLAFARAGRQRAAGRVALAAAIDRHLANPGRLVDDDVLAEAGSLLDRAEATLPRGPILDDQIRRLGELVEIASTPVRVSLHSDNETEVVIYKVGRLGTFSRTSVDLRPGTYTVVGTRPGFRDVRVEVSVRPSGPNPPIVIRCEEEV